MLRNIKREYTLVPSDNRKSFYGKCKVFETENGFRFLQSYDTIVAREDKEGKIHRLWGGWSLTTGRHIKEFCGLNKSEWDKLEVESEVESESEIGA